jgi:hypothetical protein
MCIPRSASYFTAQNSNVSKLTACRHFADSQETRGRQARWRAARSFGQSRSACDHRLQARRQQVGVFMRPSLIANGVVTCRGLPSGTGAGISPRRADLHPMDGRSVGSVQTLR